MTRSSLLTAFLVFVLSPLGEAAPKWENVQHHESRRIWVGMGVDASSNVYVNAYGSGVTGWNDYFTRKLSGSTGVQAWERIYGAKTYGGGESRGFAVDAAGNSYVTGYDGWAGSDGRKAFNLTLQYRPDGKSGWTKKAGDPKNGGHGVKIDAQGNIFLGGHAGNTPKNPINNDINVVKLSAKGKVLWQRSFGGPNGGNDSFDDFEFDAAGNVIVLGRGSDGVLVAKLAAATGNVLWVRTFTQPTSMLSGAADMAVGGDGDVALVGSTESKMVFGGNPKTVTVKISGADGSTMWEKIRGLGWRSEGGTAVVMDADGNVYTAARTSSGSSSDEWRITCHGADQGDIVWQQVRLELGVPRSLALTGHGAVIVLGTAGNATQQFLRTEIYEKEYGVLMREDMWESTIGDLSVPSTDSILIAPSGDIIVAGSGASGDWDQHGAHAILCYPPAPPIPTGEIAISAEPQPSGPLASGTPMDFGARLLLLTSGADKAVYLTNVGAGAIGGVKVEVVGPHANQFWVPITMNQPMVFGPGNSLRVSVNFQPSQVMENGVPSLTAGPRQATLRITGHGQGNQPFEIPLSGYAMGSNEFFSQWATSSGAAPEHDATPHGDGVSNLVKYAFNLDGSRPDARTMVPGGMSGLPLIRLVKVQSTHYLEVEFISRVDRGVRYYVKSSNSLAPDSFTTGGNWNYEGSGPINPDWYRVKMRRAVDPKVDRRLFTRVDVELVSP